MPISNDAYKLLKHISENACSYDDVSKFLKADYQFDKTYGFLNRNGYILFEDKFVLTEKGKIALESYTRLSKAELKATIAIVLSFVSLLASIYIGLKT
jgi:hypothetical protein